MGRRLVVSDVHGEGRRLAQVLESARYNPDQDRLFLLGDFIDRGEDSKLTVELVQELVAYGAIALKGNHEDLLGRAVHSRGAREVGYANGGWKTARDFGDEFPPDDVVEFLIHLPLFHEEEDYILVHAGLRPDVPLVQQREEDLLWIRDEFLDDHRGKTVVFGHTPTWFLHKEWEPWFEVDKIGIDTGAGYIARGGRLTLLDLDSRQRWVA